MSKIGSVKTTYYHPKRGTAVLTVCEFLRTHPGEHSMHELVELLYGTYRRNSLHSALVAAIRFGIIGHQSGRPGRGMLYPSSYWFIGYMPVPKRVQAKNSPPIDVCERDPLPLRQILVPAALAQPLRVRAPRSVFDLGGMA